MNVRATTSRSTRAKVWIPALLLVAAGVVSSVLAAPPPLPETPTPASSLIYARPFSLDEGFRFEWSAEKPVVREGWILVIEVDPELVYPRQTAEPVLFVGDRTAHRVNFGYPQSLVLAVVPGELDLAAAPIWFGTPELPERVDTKRALAERALADAAGIKPFARAVTDAAAARGGLRLRLAGPRALDRVLSALLAEYIATEESPGG